MSEDGKSIEVPGTAAPATASPTNATSEATKDTQVADRTLANGGPKPSDGAEEVATDAPEEGKT